MFGSARFFTEDMLRAINLTNVVYLILSVRRALLALALFFFELGFLMNMNSQLVNYLTKYACIRKLNTKWSRSTPQEWHRPTESAASACSTDDEGEVVGNQGEPRGSMNDNLGCPLLTSTHPSVGPVPPVAGPHGSPLDVPSRHISLQPDLHKHRSAAPDGESYPLATGGTAEDMAELGMHLLEDIARFGREDGVVPSAGNGPQEKAMGDSRNNCPFSPRPSAGRGDAETRSCYDAKEISKDDEFLREKCARKCPSAWIQGWGNYLRRQWQSQTRKQESRTRRRGSHLLGLRLRSLNFSRKTGGKDHLSVFSKNALESPVQISKLLDAAGDEGDRTRPLGPGASLLPGLQAQRRPMNAFRIRHSLTKQRIDQEVNGQGLPRPLKAHSIESSKTSKVQNWLLIQYVLHYPPALFIHGRRVVLSNKDIAATIAEILFNQLVKDNKPQSGSTSSSLRSDHGPCGLGSSDGILTLSGQGGNNIDRVTAPFPPTTTTAGGGNLCHATRSQSITSFERQSPAKKTSASSASALPPVLETSPYVTSSSTPTKEAASCSESRGIANAETCTGKGNRIGYHSCKETKIGEREVSPCRPSLERSLTPMTEPSAGVAALKKKASKCSTSSRSRSNLSRLPKELNLVSQSPARRPGNFPDESDGSNVIQSAQFHRYETRVPPLLSSVAHEQTSEAGASSARRPKKSCSHEGRTWRKGNRPTFCMSSSSDVPVKGEPISTFSFTPEYKMATALPTRGATPPPSLERESSQDGQSDMSGEDVSGVSETCERRATRHTNGEGAYWTISNRQGTQGELRRERHGADRNCPRKRRGSRAQYEPDNATPCCSDTTQERASSEEVKRGGAAVGRLRTWGQAPRAKKYETLDITESEASTLEKRSRWSLNGASDRRMGRNTNTAVFFGGRGRAWDKREEDETADDPIIAAYGRASASLSDCVGKQAGYSWCRRDSEPSPYLSPAMQESTRDLLQCFDPCGERKNSSPTAYVRAAPRIARSLAKKTKHLHHIRGHYHSSAEASPTAFAPISNQCGLSLLGAQECNVDRKPQQRSRATKEKSRHPVERPEVTQQPDWKKRRVLRRVRQSAELAAESYDDVLCPRSARDSTVPGTTIDEAKKGKRQSPVAPIAFFEEGTSAWRVDPCPDWNIHLSTRKCGGRASLRCSRVKAAGLNDPWTSVQFDNEDWCFYTPRQPRPNRPAGELFQSKREMPAGVLSPVRLTSSEGKESPSIYNDLRDPFLSPVAFTVPSSLPSSPPSEDYNCEEANDEIVSPSHVLSPTLVCSSYWNVPSEDTPTDAGISLDKIDVIENPVEKIQDDQVWGMTDPERHSNLQLDTSELNMHSSSDVGFAVDSTHPQRNTDAPVRPHKKQCIIRNIQLNDRFSRNARPQAAEVFNTAPGAVARESSWAAKELGEEVITYEPASSSLHELSRQESVCANSIQGSSCEDDGRGKDGLEEAHEQCFAEAAYRGESLDGSPQHMTVQKKTGRRSRFFRCSSSGCLSLSEAVPPHSPLSECSSAGLSPLYASSHSRGPSYSPSHCPSVRVACAPTASLLSQQHARLTDISSKPFMPAAAALDNCSPFTRDDVVCTCPTAGQDFGRRQFCLLPLHGWQPPSQSPLSANSPASPSCRLVQSSSSPPRPNDSGTASAPDSSSLTGNSTNSSFQMSSVAAASSSSLSSTFCPPAASASSASTPMQTEKEEGTRSRNNQPSVRSTGDNLGLSSACATVPEQKEASVVGTRPAAVTQAVPSLRSSPRTVLNASKADSRLFVDDPSQGSSSLLSHSRVTDALSNEVTSGRTREPLQSPGSQSSALRTPQDEGSPSQSLTGLSGTSRSVTSSAAEGGQMASTKSRNDLYQSQHAGPSPCHPVAATSTISGCGSGVRGVQRTGRGTVEQPGNADTQQRQKERENPCAPRKGGESAILLDLASCQPREGDKREEEDEDPGNTQSAYEGTRDARGDERICDSEHVGAPLFSDRPRSPSLFCSSSLSRSCPLQSSSEYLSSRASCQEQPTLPAESPASASPSSQPYSLGSPASSPCHPTTPNSSQSSSLSSSAFILTSMSGLPAASVLTLSPPQPTIFPTASGTSGSTQKKAAPQTHPKQTLPQSSLSASQVFLAAGTASTLGDPVTCVPQVSGAQRPAASSAGSRSIGRESDVQTLGQVGSPNSASDSRSPRTAPALSQAPTEASLSPGFLNACSSPTAQSSVLAHSQSEPSAAVGRAPALQPSPSLREQLSAAPASAFVPSVVGKSSPSAVPPAPSAVSLSSSTFSSSAAPLGAPVSVTRGKSGASSVSPEVQSAPHTITSSPIYASQTSHPAPASVPLDVGESRSAKLCTAERPRCGASGGGHTNTSTSNQRPDLRTRIGSDAVAGSDPIENRGGPPERLGSLAFPRTSTTREAEKTVGHAGAVSSAVSTGTSTSRGRAESTGVSCPGTFPSCGDPRAPVRQSTRERGGFGNVERTSKSPPGETVQLVSSRNNLPRAQTLRGRTTDRINDSLRVSSRETDEGEERVKRTSRRQARDDSGEGRELRSPSGQCSGGCAWGGGGRSGSVARHSADSVEGTFSKKEKNDEVYLGRETIELYLRPEEAEEFMKQVDFAGHGKINAEMFKRAILNIYNARKRLVRGLRSQGSVASTVLRMVSLLLWFICAVVLLLVVGVDMNTVIVSGAAFLSALTVALSYLYQHFITAVIFVALTNPYNIGDRIRVDGGEILTVRKIRTYTTEFDTVHGRPVIYSNSVLFSRVLTNESRAKNSVLELKLRVAIGTPHCLIKALETKMRKFVEQRPMDFVKDSFSVVVYHVQPGESIDYSLWMTCVEGWGNYLKVLNLRSEVYFYLAKQITKLGIAFHLAPQPVTLTSEPAPVLHMKAVERDSYMQGRRSVRREPSVRQGSPRPQGSERRADVHPSFHGPLAASCRKNFEETTMYSGSRCNEAVAEGTQLGRRGQDVSSGSATIEAVQDMRRYQGATRETAVRGTRQRLQPGVAGRQPAAAFVTVQQHLRHRPAVRIFETANKRNYRAARKAEKMPCHKVCPVGPRTLIPRCCTFKAA
ncbi:small conductance mechanosensitive ion channel family protein [Cystoisospora suis]|uniref:Small conductance mechanosensitive ion channel family protein n=1 Tax=Cystoisospora suis TaxID=483139 RepID=A0A2C6LCQ5_9APIC|nr:small conductance mechanosensitive ion channel family protein [Cystoisospora suis]